MAQQRPKSVLPVSLRVRTQHIYLYLYLYLYLSFSIYIYIHIHVYIYIAVDGVTQQPPKSVLPPRLGMVTHNT